MTVADRIEALLAQHAVPYETIEHSAARSADEIAQLRGTPLEIGGKSIVMKVDRVGFCVLAIRASDAIDNRAFRKHLGARRYRFATLDELDELTGLTPGRVPPFGRPIFDLPLYVEASLAENPRIAFTPGTKTRSMTLATRDWLRAAQPDDVFAFGKARTQI